MASYIFLVFYVFREVLGGVMAQSSSAPVQIKRDFENSCIVVCLRSQLSTLATVLLDNLK